MVLETVETPEDFGAAITRWAERMRDKILDLPPEIRTKHFTAVGAFLGDLNRDYGFKLTIDGIEHSGPLADSLHVDRDLLARRAACDYPQS